MNRQQRYEESSYVRLLDHAATSLENRNYAESNKRRQTK